ncbi:MAG: toll/interleukin-1 receptor domain-containing protein [Hyphomonadaceae bacterium]
MSVGYLLAATADIAVARDIADGFDLDVIDAASIGDYQNTASALAGAANVALLLSHASTRDDAFVSLCRAVAQKLPRAQLIVINPEVRVRFVMFAADWPAMSADDARRRAALLAQHRDQSEDASAFGVDVFGNGLALPPRAADIDAAAPIAPADATVFAPKKLRRVTPELIRIVVHQPKDLQAVLKAARKYDPRNAPAPEAIPPRDVPFGSSIGVALEVRGGVCDGDIQRAVWRGEPIDFSFVVDADQDAEHVVFTARVLIDDAHIGSATFTRPAIGADRKATGLGDRVRLKRHKRVFLSYADADRDAVATIAATYARAGVAHFWDRGAPGEHWPARLKHEIERADLFHLCWSKAAAQTDWVTKDAAFALARQKRRKKPDICVQLLDGPPAAPYPPELEALNAEDIARGALTGYARSDPPRS